MVLAFEPAEHGIMRRPPHPPGAPILTSRLMRRIVLVSVLMLAAAFGLFLHELEQGRSLAQARTLAMNVFVFVEMFYLFNCGDRRGGFPGFDCGRCGKVLVAGYGAAGSAPFAPSGEVDADEEQAKADRLQRGEAFAEEEEGEQGADHRFAEGDDGDEGRRDVA
jgi:cation transport ATPase-like protein